MNHITDVTELIPNRFYWLRDKKTGNSCQTSELKTVEGRAYFENRIWALPDNNQVMERWDIFGPCHKGFGQRTLAQPPDFNAMILKGKKPFKKAITTLK